MAYHADDGKIFVGSGIGDPFGPKCSKGDVMGCGILFPRDFVSNDAGASDVSRDSDASEDERDAAWIRDVDPDLVEASDSDDEFWMHQAHDQPEEGKKVQVKYTCTCDQFYNSLRHYEMMLVGGFQVFFTRNGKRIGHREAVMPAGGFYPTVGMLSSDEKVHVDLHPLTG